MLLVGRLAGGAQVCKVFAVPSEKGHVPPPIRSAGSPLTYYYCE